MFGRKKTEETSDAAARVERETAAPAGVGKGRPTPTRKEREAARRKPLIPADRKAAAEESKRVERERRAIAQAGMAAGDERYLGARDAGPQRRFARDWVDARFNLGEYILPLLILMFLVLFIPNRNASLWLVWVMYAFLILAVLDAVLMTLRMKSALKAKFGSVQRGTSWYAAMRAFSLRRLRLPKPQVKRGQRPS